MKRMFNLVIALSLVSSSFLSFSTNAFANSAATSSSLDQAQPITTKNSKILWDDPRPATEDTPITFFRIPALTTTNDGDVLAVTDARYRKQDDIGVNAPQQIDILLQKSEDNGANWSNETNLTGEYSTESYGFGDAAVVADRDSDKVLIVAAAGSISFPNSTTQNPIRIAKMVSEDGGEKFSNPIDITEQIYKLDKSWQGLFAASGRIMQSRYIKVDEYHRLYMAILAKNTKDFKSKKNYVLYSDDFGETWEVLGGSESPVPGGDEAKLEELPNGNVVISSREEKGRYINIFTYDKDDNQYHSGTWENSKRMLQYSDQGQGTNGEILVVYAKEKETDKYTHLILQTIPTAGGRKNVKIFYRAVDSNVSSVDQYISDWDRDHNSYLVKDGLSGYSTMTIQADGSIGILIEEDYVDKKGYDIVYKNLDLETITNGKYENAFTGIGSKDTPYVVASEEQLTARNSVFADEKVHWVLEGEAKLIDESTTLVMDEHIKIRASGVDVSGELKKKVLRFAKVDDLSFYFTKTSNKESVRLLDGTYHIYDLTEVGTEKTVHYNLKPINQLQITVSDGKINPEVTVLDFSKQSLN